MKVSVAASFEKEAVEFLITHQAALLVAAGRLRSGIVLVYLIHAECVDAKRVTNIAGIGENFAPYRALLSRWPCSCLRKYLSSCRYWIWCDSERKVRRVCRLKSIQCRAIERMVAR